MTAFRQLIDKIRSLATSTRDQGDRFEQLMRLFFLNDPIYTERFSDVWLWTDWPKRGKEQDTGIDLVAKNRYDDGYTAVQCKCYAEEDTIQRNDIDSFLVRSAKKPFTHRIIVSTTAKWGKHAEDIIDDQPVPVQRLDINELEQSPIDWAQYDLDKPDKKVSRKDKKSLREHQKMALENVRKGFETHDRGRLIMACGTGKTFTSLKIAEEHAGKGGLVLFLVPSLSLLSQTLREWTAESAIPLRCYAVCSDPKTGQPGKDESPVKRSDLAIPATTNAEMLARSLTRKNRDEKMTVIFSTYHSIEAINEAQKNGVPEFDLIICDEAHRTTGVTLAEDDESQFVRVHDAKFIKAKKRLYMTATPRLYGDESRRRAAEIDAVLCSMDDETLYGPELYRLGFSEAVTKGLLSDYKVIVLAISEKHVSQSVQRQLKETGGEIELHDAVKIIGCWNGLSRKFIDEETVRKTKRPDYMKRAVAFTTTIKQSQQFTQRFAELVQEYLRSQPDDKHTLNCEVKHVDGTLNALLRTERLEWLKSDNIEKNHCRILSNARCLSEGVDVPALDAVMFLNPRNSKVDVVQSVGRVMRKVEGKEYGYIILPIGIPSDMQPEEALSNNEKYKVVWDVLQALRAHDDRFNVTINQIDLNKNRPDKIQIIGIGTPVPAEQEPEESVHGEENIGDKPPKATTAQRFFDFDLEVWKNAIYGKIVTKCGEKPYLEQWAKDVAKIAEDHVEQIESLIEFPQYRETFDRFWGGLKQDVNPDITEVEVIEMLSQHLITKPVFDALFEGFSFTKENPISQTLDAMIDSLIVAGFNTEIEKLKKFYDSVRQRVSNIDNAAGKQRVITELYDKFFKTAFPRMAERLGIVYTPVEVVDFIIKSVDQALRSEFGKGIGEEGVHVLDPFTGTGTFLVRLIQSGLIDKKDLKRKYHKELHANDIVLLAYYIAAINIEEVYHEQANRNRNREIAQYEPFEGVVLTDTFRLLETQFAEMSASENSKRARRQKKSPIYVIVGNPPYSVGARREGIDDKNVRYDQLDTVIRNTYAADSCATNKNSLYDSYIRAFRWATDRIGERGIVCYVSNGGWLDGNAMDGFRKHLAEEFTDIYCFNLRGNARTAGEQRRKEKGNVFGEGSRTPVAITLMIKNPAKTGKPCAIHYRDIGDYLDREEKLEIIAKANGLQGVQWESITPNKRHDWINQRGEEFDSFVSLGDKRDKNAETVFDNYSRGLATGRDAWCYNYSHGTLETNMKRMIAFYNEQVALYELETHRNEGRKIDVDRFVDNDPTKIAWDRELKIQLAKFNKFSLESYSLTLAMYRPFCKTQVYFNRRLNSMVYQMPKIFSEPGIENLVICVPGIGSTTPFSLLMSNVVPDLGINSASQCFPLYTYEEAKGNPGLLGNRESGGQSGQYVRRENISDAMLQKFRERYGARKIGKEDIFYYVYGILHSRSYRERFAADLNKQLPRIPLVDDFWTFSKAGRKLGELHVNYETLKPYPLKEITTGSKPNFKVTKMKFPPKQDKGRTIIYNDSLTLDGIPPETYQYIVNGKSALGWIMDQYQVKTDKESRITKDPNDWCREHNDERYIVDLVKRIVTLSVESVKIIDALPGLEF